ncbi:hypothetical protein BC834DRAFT_626919 [Gloeopeniophorella convolvens]|nr:hypothetical protein BC834DRAFT_626919 [Gloeopeniophorella convolvens]
MASPSLDSRNLLRIGTELSFLEDILAIQPGTEPEHLRAWVVWMQDMGKQWNEYQAILKSVGFQEAPTGDLLEREYKVSSRKKEAEATFRQLRESVAASKGQDQTGSSTWTGSDADFSALINDHCTSTDAEGEPDTTASAPAAVNEKVNGEVAQKKETRADSNVKASPAPDDNDELQDEELGDGVRKRPVPCELCQRRGRSCIGKEGRACLPCKERRVACSHVAKPRREAAAGTPESDLQPPDTRSSQAMFKRPRTSDPRPGGPASAGPSAQAGARSLKRKLSRGPGLRGTPGGHGKRVRVGRGEDSDGDPFGSDDDEFMEAARAARTSSAWDADADAESYQGVLSAEDSARVLERIRALEEKARDIVGEISALKTYFLH